MNSKQIISIFRDMIRTSGKTQKEFAKLIGVSDRYMKRLMSGRDKPSEKLLRRIGIDTIKIYQINFGSPGFSDLCSKLEMDKIKIKIIIDNNI